MFPLPGMFFHLIFTWFTPHPLRFCSSAIFKKAPLDHCMLNCVTASLSSPHPPLSFAFSLSPFNRPRNLIFVVFLAILHLLLSLLLFLHFYYVLCLCSHRNGQESVSVFPKHLEKEVVDIQKIFLE